MSIFFTCVCGKSIFAHDSQAGAEVMCPFCGQRVIVPRPPIMGAPPGGFGGGAPTPPVSSSRTSGMATAALVLGLIGLVCCGFFPGLLAIVFGAVAIGHIRREPGLQGHGLAVAGIILGVIDILGWGAFMALWATLQAHPHFR